MSASSPPPDFPFTFRCCRSGNCCARPEGRVRVLESEVAAIAAASGLTEAGFRSRYLVPGPFGDHLVRLAPGGACPFLTRQDGTASCAVYAARPAHCRTFPFWEELRRRGPLLAEVVRFCPGVSRLDEPPPADSVAGQSATPNGRWRDIPS